ncbi:16S rRNA (cytidine(1402)-2'-O)-methyltransferase [Hyphomicrobium sp.]|uniref:16S rRNA (cytidine(1402)-2'-O)-methyltransferase n=1 Tax=Hyphomicrobium sp. TaxID=82 RepID=UPI002E2F21C5|nr:16S rRNA (cytidine(1402)-2'-O)-methyltransferase [Hyphomicrobium sp.]HEX2841614.1 16S rRNA (cytidine(1402)-2'-O)-methyltransferase [Hyphomicrobium sp.]
MNDETSEIAMVNAAAIAGRASFELERQLALPHPPGLYLVATPIGHLADMTLRAIATLARADVVYCEDTRHSRTLLAHYAIRAPLRPYHEHNAEEQRPRILNELADGKVVALISDAGTPLVSDPGFKLVREAAAHGHAVVSVPGPSASLTALTVSGLPTDAFFFAGFLPAKEGARRTRLAELAAVPGTLVFFEAPTRTAATLADLAHVLGDREAAVARELTKLHEEVRRGSLSTLARDTAEEALKGEVVIVVGPPAAGDVDDAAIEASLARALETLSIRDASRMVSETLKVPKARVYDLALELKRRDPR